MKRLSVGQTIEHHEMPGFVMKIEAVKECEVDQFRSEPHSQYQITDPEGSQDWLCAYDVHEVTS